MDQQRKMDHEDGPSGGQFGGGGPEVYSPGWSQDPGFTDWPRYPTLYPPHMGKVQGTGQGEVQSESGLTLTNIIGYMDNNGRVHNTATDQHGREWLWSYEHYPESDAEKNWAIAYRDTDGQVHRYYRQDDGTWAEDHALEDQNLAKDNFNPYPYSPDGQVENLAQDHLPPPSPYGQEENLAQDHLPPPDTGIRGVEHFGAGRLPGPLQEPAPPAPDPEREAQERARAEEELNPDLPPPPADQIPPAEQPVPPTDPNADREPPEETPGPSFEDLGIEEHHAKGTSKIPDLVEEPAPAPPGPMLAGDLAGTGVAYPGLVEGGDEGLLPPAAQTPEAEPPVQPPPPPGDAGDGGIPGLGVPYQDFIPLYPMVQDPATGEWRNAQPEEIPKPDQQPEGNDLTQLNPNLLDPIAPGPTLDTGLVERIEQSPGLVDKVNQDPAVAEALERDPTQIDQIEQYLGVAEQRTTEPSGGTDLGGAADPSLTDAGSTAGQDGHDHDDGVFEGI